MWQKLVVKEKIGVEPSYDVVGRVDHFNQNVDFLKIYSTNEYHITVVNFSVQMNLSGKRKGVKYFSLAA